ncbi:hypothetical protein N2152v2_005172 [Parachlorella kessleri]
MGVPSWVQWPTYLGICEQPFPGAKDGCPANLTAVDDELLGASQRDTVLACISDPAERSAKVVEAVAWSWKGYSGAHWVNLSLTLVDSLDTLYLAGLEQEFEGAAKWVIEELDVAAPGPVSLFETTIRIVGGLLSAHHLCSVSHPQLSKGLGDKAVELGTRLLPALTSSPSGIPYSDVNLRTGAASAPLWANISSLSEVATLSLEFTHLSRLSGRPEFEELALAVHDKLQTFVEQHGPLLPLYYNPVTGGRAAVGGSQTATLGARADSYYEYLLKQWLITGKQPGSPLLGRYVDAMRAVRTRLLRRTAPTAAGGLVYVGEQARPGMAASSKMDHLVCFLPGLLALGDLHGVSTIVVPTAPIVGGATQDPSSSSGSEGSADTASSGGDGGTASKDSEAGNGSQGAGAGADSSGSGSNAIAGGGSGKAAGALSELEVLPDLELAEQLASTCYELYRRTPSGLAPEIVHFSERAEDGGEEYPGKHLHDVGHGDFYIKPQDAHNLLRPETVESLYMLWKVTGRPRYRDWAWAIFRAFQRWCRVEGEEQCLGAAAETEDGLAEGDSAGPAAPADGAASNGSSGDVEGAGVEAAPSMQQGLQLQQGQESAGKAAGGIMQEELVTMTEEPEPQQGQQQGHQAAQQGPGEGGVDATAGRELLLQQIVEAVRLDPPFHRQQQHGQQEGFQPQEQQQQQRAGQPEVLLGRRQLQHWQQQRQRQQQRERQQTEEAQQQQQEEAPRCQQGQQGLRAGGYTSLASVLQVPPRRQDKMESFWVAETLKYLFLTFSEPPERCLDESCGGGNESSGGVPGGEPPLAQPTGRTLVSLWTQVFNTEAHPLPTVGPRKEEGLKYHAAHAAAVHASAEGVGTETNVGAQTGRGGSGTASRGAGGSDKISGMAGGAGKPELTRSSSGSSRDEL